MNDVRNFLQNLRSNTSQVRISKNKIFEYDKIKIEDPEDLNDEKHILEGKIAHPKSLNLCKFIDYFSFNSHKNHLNSKNNQFSSNGISETRAEHQKSINRLQMEVNLHKRVDNSIKYGTTIYPRKLDCNHNTLFSSKKNIFSETINEKQYRNGKYY